MPAQITPFGSGFSLSTADPSPAACDGGGRLYHKQPVLSPENRAGDAGEVSRAYPASHPITAAVTDPVSAVVRGPWCLPQSPGPQPFREGA